MPHVELRATGETNHHGQEIWEMRQPSALFAGDLVERAADYLGAFDKLTADGSDRSPYACYFLAAHSLELFLKAYLVSVGRSKKGVKDLGHKIGPIFSRCKQAGLPTVASLAHLVGAMAEMNSENDFRYPTGYRLSLPSTRLCKEVLYPLHAAIEPAIKRTALEANLDFAANTRHLQGSVIRWSD
jgi:hypothetical protein